jgi:hypothetical protein
MMTVTDERRPDLAGQRPPGVPSSRIWPAFVRELALIVSAALLYSLVRGLTSDRVAVAFDNAERVIAFERALGIFVEPELQRAVLDHDLAVTAMNAVYIGFWPLIIITLLWLLLRRPVEYPRFRNAVLASGGLSLLLFAFYPLAPPRFLPQYGFVDTIAQDATGYRTLTSPALVNDYAAMPSLHLGWVLLVGIAVATLAPYRVVRVLGTVLPMLMFASIVLTGNHYIVDGVVGGAVIGLGLVIATALDRRAGVRRAVGGGRRAQREIGQPDSGHDPGREVPARS